MFIDLIVVEGKLRTSADSTFYNLEVASGSTVAANGNLTVNKNLTIHQGGELDVNAYKVISVGGDYTYLTGRLSNNETKSVGASPVSFNDGKGVLTAQLSRETDSSNYTVTTRAGWLFPEHDFGTTCPLVDNAVWRYYNIVPATQGSTTVRLYYQEAELNGNAEDSLKVYHCTAGGWYEQAGTVTRNTGENWVQVSGVTEFSPFILSSAVPTAVELVRFEVRPEGTAVRLEWETANEIDNLGFNLYRAEKIDGERTRLNAALIPSLVPPGSPYGDVYEYWDLSVEPGGRYYYWLEDRDLDGLSTLHEPVAVKLLAAPGKPRRIFLPGVWGR